MAAWNPPSKLQSIPVPRKQPNRRMRGSALTTLAVLSVPFFLLAQADGRSAGKSQATEDLDGSLRARKIPHPLNDDSGRTERRRQPCTGLWKVARVAGASGGICSKAQPEKKADSKRQAPRLLPLKSKTQGLQNHLKGHGKFNMDMVSGMAPPPQPPSLFNLMMPFIARHISTIRQ